MSGFKQAVLKELKRFFPLVAVAALILIPDTGSFVVLFAIGVAIVISAVSHLIRKILFPYVDLEWMANKAGESAIGAAIVFASISGLLAVIISATCNLLR
jgi:hypothetical protein